jgi:hypothetical protein
MKLTPWFDGAIKPVREGVYETEEDDRSRWFNYFDGRSWYYGGRTVDDAWAGFSYFNEMPRSIEPECVARWRGVKEPA